MLGDSYSVLVQMQNQIEQLIASANNPNIGPEDLPPSLVPTEQLYAITVCYEMMYDMLLKENLIKTGNPKSSTTIH